MADWGSSDTSPGVSGTSALPRFGRGFGRGLVTADDNKENISNVGFGGARPKTDNLTNGNGSGSGKPSGGGLETTSSGSGFGTTSNAGGNDDGWNEDSSSKSAFGSSGGFGRGVTVKGDENTFGRKPGGFGGGDTGGFGSSGGSSFGKGRFSSKEDSDVPRGGGFGRGGGGGGNCYKCGESGHMARDCPSEGSSGGGGFGGGGGRGNCFKCGESGHMARECPSEGSSGGGGFGGGRGGGGGGGGKCFKCGESGHMSRECTSEGSGGGGFGGGGRGGGGKCFKCGESGHMSRECTSEGSSGGGFSGGGRGGGGGNCFKCGESGHMARECTSEGSSGGGFGGGGGGRGGGGNCFKCGQSGHMARECTSEGSSGGGGFGSRGGGFGSRGGGRFGSSGGGGGGFGGGGGRGFGSSGGGGGGGGSGGGSCFKCGESGHFARDCTNEDTSGGRSGGGGGGGGGCFKCGGSGHFARECPEAGGDGERKPRGSGCFKCGEEGHMAKDCEKEDVDGERKKTEIYIPPAPSEDETVIFKSIEKGINFDKYDAIPVEVSGKDPVQCIHSFEQAQLYPKFLENVRKANYDKPTPIQKYAIPIILAGRDLMGCAQTGSGKTAAFLLPVLTGMMANGLTGSQFSETQEPQAIVVAPTRELVQQIYMEARKFSHGTMLRPVLVYGGTSVGHQLRQVEQGTHIIVGTPGRLVDFITKGKIKLNNIKYMILDEADRMLDMGFEGEVRKIVEQFGMPGKDDRQTLMFSATFPEEIQKLAGDFLKDYLFVTVGQVGGANTDVQQNVYQLDGNEKRTRLTEILSEAGLDKTLVFVETKRNADFLAAFLSGTGFPTTSIHGDRLQREREEALGDFKNGRTPIMIATSVAARGLDIPEVKHVINYDLPKAIDEYVHRIGRTGRCGNLGKATSFFCQNTDGDMARPLVKILADAHQEVPSWLESAASSSMSNPGYGSAGGRFQSRDIRGKRFESNTADEWFDGDDKKSGGFGGGISNGFSAGGGGGDEESWD